MANIKEIKRLRGGDLQVTAQANVQIDAEIGQKDHFRMETGFCREIISGWKLNMDWDSIGKRFIELCRLIDRLRSPGGCPWDAKQTVDSIKRYLLEEAYEVVDSVEKGDPQDVCGELGDLLFQIVFMARIESETGAYDVLDVLDGIIEKMIRRHPHVFGEAQVEDAEEVARNWAEIKKHENHGADSAASLLDSVPVHLPALMRAHRMAERASKYGLESGDADSLLDEARKDFRSLEFAVAGGGGFDQAMGDLLFSLAALARVSGVHAEDLLRLSNRRFQEDVERVEGRFKSQGLDLDAVPRERKAEVWQGIRKERV
ncbi:Phosphoribosyl-ATP diphosphatase [uncultured Desulfatiglans sp.]|nr:Phosphoribosyl-ATP diphosphatase [uncultured Desulfatiglans sp.]